MLRSILDPYLEKDRIRKKLRVSFFHKVGSVFLSDSVSDLIFLRGLNPDPQRKGSLETAALHKILNNTEYLHCLNIKDLYFCLLYMFLLLKKSIRMRA